MRDDENQIRHFPTNKRINVTYLLDSSGSFAGGPYNSAVSGFREEFNNNKSIKEVDWSYTLYEFGSRDCGKEWFFRENDLSKVEGILNKLKNWDHMTALNDAIHAVLTKIQSNRDKNINELVYLCSDGHENNSGISSKRVIEKLIADLRADGVEIKFIGTNEIKSAIMRQYGITQDNFMEYTATAGGVQKMSQQRAAYSISYAKEIVNFNSNNND